MSSRAFRSILAILASIALAGTALADDKDNRILELGRFRFESGIELPNAKLSYTTQGTLNEERSNAVLLPSWYSGDHHGYQFLIGAEKALDPSKYFLVSTDMFANGFSSSPSNTPPPFAGPDFPEIAIRDNVRAVHRLLTEELGVTHLRAVIGFSMGAQQALQWAVSHPEMVEAAVAICGNAKEYPFGIVRLEGAKSALTADGAWNGGRYGHPPEVGLRALARHWASWGVSQEWWRRETYRELGYDSIEAWLVQAEEGWLSRDANNVLWQAKMWQSHNVGDTPGFSGDFEKALRSIKARVLFMPSETDLYFPVADSEYESGLIPGAKLVPIRSIWGHGAGAGRGPGDAAFLNRVIAEFLEER
ncbi:MAG TPA: alpha/beta fold hydrolase [Vicinamibacteria bacterium]|nr:alpha/beta fold hydrolase [Vicinamibacteria bacterium]